MTREEAAAAKVILKRYDALCTARGGIDWIIDQEVGINASGDLKEKILELMKLGRDVRFKEIDDEIAGLQINTSGATEDHSDPGPRRVIT